MLPPLTLNLPTGTRATRLQKGARSPSMGAKSYLTAGPGAFVGQYNGYALDTLQPPGTFIQAIDHTNAGLRGQNRLPNNFTVPGCCLP